MLKKFVPVLVSLLVAAGLWLTVRNLDRSPAHFRVPVAYEHPDDVVLLPPVPADVDLRVLATRAKLRALQPSEFDVRIRNRTGRLGRELVYIDPKDVRTPFGVVVQQVDPPQLVVNYDHKQARSVPVVIDVAGTPAGGYEVATDKLSVQPSSVRVVGPASLFQDDLAVRTEPVDVSGRTQGLGPLRLALRLPGPAFSIDTLGHVQATIPIQPVIGQRTVEDVPVRLLLGAWQASPPNPRVLRVTIEGPEPTLARLPAGAIVVEANISDFEPRAEDYRVEPTVRIDPVACPDCKLARLSQRFIHVNVRPQRLPVAEPGAAGGTAPGGPGPAAGAPPRPEGPAAPPLPSGTSRPEGPGAADPRTSGSSRPAAPGSPRGG